MKCKYQAPVQILVELNGKKILLLKLKILLKNTLCNDDYEES